MKLPAALSVPKVLADLYPLALVLAFVFIVARPLTLCGPRPPAEVREVERVEAAADVEHVQAVEAERVTTRTTVATRERRPDGAEVERVEVVEREEAAAVAVAAARAELREVRERERVEVARPSWRVELQAGWRVERPELRPSVLGVAASRRLAGPVWLGAWARTDRTVGVSVAFEW